VFGIGAGPPHRSPRSAGSARTRPHPWATCTATVSMLAIRPNPHSRFARPCEGGASPLGIVRPGRASNTVWMSKNAKPCRLRARPQRSRGHRGDRPCAARTFAWYLKSQHPPDRSPRTCPGHRKGNEVADLSKSQALLQPYLLRRPDDTRLSATDQGAGLLSHYYGHRLSEVISANMPGVVSPTHPTSCNSSSSTRSAAGASAHRTRPETLPRSQVSGKNLNP
jgi:hypothetical protein